MGDGPKRLHVTIEGLVQGVGFRHATRHEARALGLSGWVKNLPDGRVEAVFQGPRSDLEAMLSWCREGPHLSRVEHVEAEWSDAVDAVRGFDIAF